MWIMEQFKKNKRSLLIIGGSSTALEIRECVDSFYKNKFSEIFNVIGDNEETTIQNVIRDSELDVFLSNNYDISYILGFTNQNLRHYFTEKLSNAHLVSIMHPTSFIYPTAKIKEGTYIGPGVVVSSNAIVGMRCLINIGVSVGHDAIIGNDCIINPGVRISGFCNIGDRTLIGANSFVFQSKRIGMDCSIDAMTYIDRDIEDKKLCTSNVSGLKVLNKRF